jgi:hypothetical protein
VLLWRYYDAGVALGPQPGWSLWNATTGQTIQTSASEYVQESGAGVFAALDANGDIQIRSMSDGSLLGVAAQGPGTAPSPGGIRVAVDGSYVFAVSNSWIRAWSLTGTLIVNHAGNYSSCWSVGAPGQLQIAGGPAGSTVVETIATTGGASEVSPPFAGTIGTWFNDGSALVTVQPNVNPDAALAATTTNEAMVYAPGGQLLQTFAGVPASANLDGRGPYFVAKDSGVTTIYDLSTGQASKDLVTSDGTLSVFRGPVIVVPYHDTAVFLRSPLLQEETFVPTISAFDADSSGLWVAATYSGVYFSGTAANPNQTGWLCGEPESSDQ